VVVEAPEGVKPGERPARVEVEKAVEVAEAPGVKPEERPARVEVE
jgi:hypothetical protein